MVSTLLQNKPAREAGYEMMQYIAARIQASPLGTDPVTVKIGSVPAGGLIVAVSSKVATAITGGTPVLSIGSTGDPGLDNLVAAMAETAGSEWLLPLATIVQPLAVETEFFVSIAGAATAGDAYVAIFFIKPVC